MKLGVQIRDLRFDYVIFPLTSCCDAGNIIVTLVSVPTAPGPPVYLPRN